MKKSLIALAALASVAGVAQAQSTVEMYGLLDTGFFQYQSTGYATQKMNAVGNLNSSNGSGYFNGSRFGLRGTEDLGSGTKASFVIEYGVNFGTSASGAADPGAAGTGVSNDAPLANMRQGYVQLQSNQLGQLRVGSQYALIDPTSDALASKQASFGGTNAAQGAHSLLKFNEAAFARAPAAIGYATPTYYGVTARVLFNPSGSVSQDGTAKQENNLQYAVDYKGGPLTAGYASMNVGNYTNTSGKLIDVLGTANDVTFNNVKNARSSLQYSVAGVQYDFGSAQVGLTNTEYKATLNSAGTTNATGNSFKHTANGIAVGYTVAPKIRLGAGYTVGKITDAGVHAYDTTGVDLYAFYDLSKRTNAYVVYGKTTYDHKDADSAAVGNAAAGNVSQSALGLGLRHTF
jgi:predicted porin